MKPSKEEERATQFLKTLGQGKSFIEIQSEEEECVEEPGEMISLREFTNACNTYLKDKHLRAMNSKQIGGVLRSEGFIVGNRKLNDISAVVIVN